MSQHKQAAEKGKKTRKRRDDGVNEDAIPLLGTGLKNEAKD